MKTIGKAVSVLCLGSVLCLAETWSGKVVDAACKDQAAAPCAKRFSQAVRLASPRHRQLLLGFSCRMGKF